MEYPALDTWMRKRRLKSPDSTALIFGEGERMTYAELAQFVDGVAETLAERGIAKGDNVAYLGENSPAFLATLFASAALGAVFVPVNTRLATPEMVHVVSDSRARILIHERDLDERLAAALPLGGPDMTLSADALPLSPRTSDPAVPRLTASPTDPAAVVYTSGTTGRAKGAVLTHGNLTWAALNAIIDYDIVSTDIALMISPMFHVASLGMGALPVLMKGGTLILERGFDPGRALNLIAEWGVTMLSGVPTTYQRLADHPDWLSTDVSTLSKLTCGGSAVPLHVVNAFEERGLRFSQGYGMTETSPGATALAPPMTRAKQGSVGVPHFFTEVRVVDEEGAPVSPGVVGEIQVAGPNVFLGYLGLPDATAASFAPGRWFQSGDQGYVDDDGYLYISGRLKDMIISGGENIYPAEVETVIADMPGVTGVAVIGVADEQWGEVPWAVLTTDGTHTPDTDSVRAHLDGRLARYKFPRNVLVVDSLPRTASGKVQKAALKAQLPIS